MYQSVTHRTQFVRTWVNKFFGIVRAYLETKFAKINVFLLKVYTVIIMYNRIIIKYLSIVLSQIDTYRQSYTVVYPQNTQA